MVVIHVNWTDTSFEISSTPQRSCRSVRIFVKVVVGESHLQYLMSWHSVILTMCASKARDSSVAIWVKMGFWKCHVDFANVLLCSTLSSKGHSKMIDQAFRKDSTRPLRICRDESAENAAIDRM